MLSVANKIIDCCGVDKKGFKDILLTCCHEYFEDVFFMCLLQGYILKV